MASYLDDIKRYESSLPAIRRSNANGRTTRITTIEDSPNLDEPTFARSTRMRVSSAGAYRGDERESRVAERPSSPLFHTRSSSPIRRQMLEVGTC